MEPTETAIAMCRAWEDLKDHVLEVGDMCYSNFFKRTFKVCGKVAHFYRLKNVPTEDPWYCAREDLTYLPTMEAALEMLPPRNHLYFSHDELWLHDFGEFAYMESDPKMTKREIAYAFVNHELYEREWKEGGWK